MRKCNSIKRTGVLVSAMLISIMLIATAVLVGCDRTVADGEDKVNGSMNGQEDDLVLEDGNNTVGDTVSAPPVYVPLRTTAGEILPVESLSFEASPLISTDGGVNTKSKAVARGANSFAFDLSRELLKNNGDGNFVVSPYSVWLPLAALVNATNDENKPALIEAIGSSGLSVDEINEAASRMMFQLSGEWKNAILETVENDPDGPSLPEHLFTPSTLLLMNAIFVSNAYGLKEDFAKSFMDYYRGGTYRADFTSPLAVDAVNQMVAENTENLITTIVSEFDPYTVAVLLNTIYFADGWMDEFDPEQTQEDVFHGPGGASQAHFMTKDDRFYYYEDRKLQALPLTFQQGGGLYLLLPKDGDANGLLSSMDANYFQEIQEESASRPGKLLLPRFEIDGNLLSLGDALTAMGIPLLDPVTAPLTGGLVEGPDPVYISEAVHKAVIKVDEKGTVAAAATAVAVGALSDSPPSEPFEMICNKPFAFVLYQNTVDGGSQVLFTGVVNQP